MATPEFLNFCLAILTNPDPRIIQSAFVCLYNLVHEGPEWRDFVISRLPIETLTENWILQPDCLPKVRGAAMSLICAYSFFEIPSESGFVILNLCGKCLAGPCEELFYPSLWSIVFLVDLCPGIRERVVQQPFPDLIDLMLYGNAPEQLAPALRLAKMLFSAGVELPASSYRNFMSLISHTNLKISKYAWQGVVILIQKFPGTIERLIEKGFLAYVRGVMETNPLIVKVRVANLLCLVVENAGIAVSEEIIAAEMIPAFLEMVQLESQDLGRRIVMVLGKLFERYNSNKRLSYELLNQGGREIFDDLIERGDELSELADHFMKTFLPEDMTPPKPVFDLPSVPVHRGPHLASMAEEVRLPRMKLWIKTPTKSEQN
jgi:hypothetical protein